MSEKKSPAQIRAEEHAAMWPGDPKRAEPNEHAERIRGLAEYLESKGLSNPASDCRSAAAEIERLAALERPWMPIETAPLDGRRVDLWLGNAHRPRAVYGTFLDGYWASASVAWMVDRDAPTHWRPEPKGPEGEA